MTVAAKKTGSWGLRFDFNDADTEIVESERNDVLVIRGVAATDKVVFEDSPVPEYFPADVLERDGSSLEGKAIVDWHSEFPYRVKIDDIIGQVTRTWWDEDRKFLMFEGEVWEPSAIEVMKRNMFAYFSVGYGYDWHEDENGVRVADSITFHHLGYLEQPADIDARLEEVVNADEFRSGIHMMPEPKCVEGICTAGRNQHQAYQFMQMGLDYAQRHGGQWGELKVPDIKEKIESIRQQMKESEVSKDERQIKGINDAVISNNPEGTSDVSSSSKGEKKDELETDTKNGDEMKEEEKDKEEDQEEELEEEENQDASDDTSNESETSEEKDSDQEESSESKDDKESKDSEEDSEADDTEANSDEDQEDTESDSDDSDGRASKPPLETLLGVVREATKQLKADNEDPVAKGLRELEGALSDKLAPPEDKAVRELKQQLKDQEDKIRQYETEAREKKVNDNVEKLIGKDKFFKPAQRDAVKKVINDMDDKTFENFRSLQKKTWESGGKGRMNDDHGDPKDDEEEEQDQENRSSQTDYEQKIENHKFR